MECVEITVEEEQRDESTQELLQHLPTEIGMGGNLLYLYQGFWCPQVSIKGMMCWVFPTGDVLIIAQTEGKAHGDTIFNVVRQNRLHPRESLYY